MDKSGAEGVVAEPVDQDEVAGIVVIGVGVEGDRAAEAAVAHRDIIEIELLGCNLFNCVDVIYVILELWRPWR